MLRKMTFLLVLLVLTFPVISSAEQYKVLRVIDGDTIEVNYRGKPETVRLLHVNTPEPVHPDKKQNIPMGNVASDYAKKRLQGKSVEIEFEGSRRRRDGRLLGYVFVDGKNFNLELVKKGLSPYYSKYGSSNKYDKDFREVEKIAQKNSSNIWGNPELTRKYLRLKSKWRQNRSRTDKSSTTGRHYYGVSYEKDIECVGDNGWTHTLKLGCPWGWKEKTA